MKHLSKITFILSLLIIFSSCSKDNLTSNGSEPTFETSVIIIQNNDFFNTHNSKSLESFALKVTLKSFDSDFKLSPVYKFDGIEYCDNGLFNDEVAGDGVYTSVQKFNSLPERNLDSDITINKSDKFQHSEKLNSFLQANYTNNDNNIYAKLKPKLSIKFGCKVRLVDCPNTHWYNTSFFGEPCVEFYDCEASVEIGIE
ncbi:hypothetical protein [Capnocytophaga canis]|uniref:hypothetical protein n=1 Tax=Capnocytophaga canis TaxID=1848903 RepID=UPI0015625532|nr:hypothetical protein [Capnocytophaga canis]